MCIRCPTAVVAAVPATPLQTGASSSTEPALGCLMRVVWSEFMRYLLDRQLCSKSQLLSRQHQPGQLSIWSRARLFTCHFQALCVLYPRFGQPQIRVALNCISKAIRVRQLLYRDCAYITDYICIDGPPSQGPSAGSPPCSSRLCVGGRSGCCATPSLKAWSQHIVMKHEIAR